MPIAETNPLAGSALEREARMRELSRQAELDRHTAHERRRAKIQDQYAQALETLCHSPFFLREAGVRPVPLFTASYQVSRWPRRMVKTVSTAGSGWPIGEYRIWGGCFTPVGTVILSGVESPYEASDYARKHDGVERIEYLRKVLRPTVLEGTDQYLDGSYWDASDRFDSHWALSNSHADQVKSEFIAAGQAVRLLIGT